FTITNLSNGSDDTLWDNASGQVGMLWLDSTGVTSNTVFYGKARDASLAGLIIVTTSGNNCKIPSLEGTCVPFFKTVNVNDLGTMPTDIAFMMVSNDVAEILSDTFANKEQNDVRLNLFTDMYNDGTMEIRVPCGVLPGQTDELIIIGGHHDTVYNGPGAIDDSSGVANVLELARQFSLLSNEIGPSYYTIKFCTWGGEEEGLHGSKAYVDMHSIELTEMLRIYVNFDMPHVDVDLENRGNSISFYGNGVEDIEHISNIIDVFKINNPEISSKYSLSHNHQNDDEIACSSDHCPFVQQIKKDIVGSYGGGSWEYHTYKDDMSRFNEESLFVTATILGSYVRYLGWGEL
ncbi:MAG TPA: M28 family metallopeptidase, partial [Candidatus Poseidoniaceae archaeon]|nr:M28 family metallopeptidase [Candidatus Poseidoniaceae archaeon]